MIDQELRLITPVDSQQLGLKRSNPLLSAADTANSVIEPPKIGGDVNGGQSEPHYQLAHDYLVPALREWLSDDQLKTRRGRAEMLLAERTSLWALKRDTRQLPSMLEYMSIIAFVPTRVRTPIQREMLRVCRQRLFVFALAIPMLIGLLIDLVFLDMMLYGWLKLCVAEVLEVGGVIFESIGRSPTIAVWTVLNFAWIGAALAVVKIPLDRVANHLQFTRLTQLLFWSSCVLVGATTAVPVLNPVLYRENYPPDASVLVNYVLAVIVITLSFFITGVCLTLMRISGEFMIKHRGWIPSDLLLRIRHVVGGIWGWTWRRLRRLIAPVQRLLLLDIRQPQLGKRIREAFLDEPRPSNQQSPTNESETPEK